MTILKIIFLKLIFKISHSRRNLRFKNNFRNKPLMITIDGNGSTQ